MFTDASYSGGLLILICNLTMDEYKTWTYKDLPASTQLLELQATTWVFEAKSLYIYISLLIVFIVPNL